MANLNIEQKKVKSLFQESKYNFLIPDYQRPYAWGEMECKTLWDDLFSFSFPNDDCDQFIDDEEYFLGPIVTFKNRNQMEVIDGQQRLTTLMLLLRAFYNKLGSMKDPRSKRMKEDIEKCIWRANEFGEFETSALKINSQVATDEDKEEFIAILKDGQGIGKKSRYAKNFNFFVEKIDAFLSNYPSYFAYFPARVLNNCVLLPIEAESQNTALRIFSTLNDRGKPLSDADIFKAQLYKYYSSFGKKDEFIETWKDLDKITSEVFHPIYGTPLDELFTRYMYYERALAEIKSSTTEALRKFYEGDGSYPLLHQPKTLSNLVSLAKFWQDVNNQETERFSDKVLKRLFVLSYAPNGMWTYITSVYFMYHRNENDEIEENAFCRFLDCITAFIWAYAITNPGVNSLRTPVYAEMVKIIRGEDVTFSDFKFSEERYRAQITNYAFNNSRAITKSMITWWAFQNGKVIDCFDDVFISLSYQNNDNQVQRGDIIVVASTGSQTLIGKTGFADRDIPKTQIGAFLRIVRPKLKTLSPYIRLIFQTDAYKDYIRNVAKGSNINNVKNAHLQNFQICLPPLEEQQRIVQKIEELFSSLDDILTALEV